MKIALIGYGRMGKEIEPILEERGHTLVGPLTRERFSEELLKKADVAIEFTVPAAAYQNLKGCIEAGVPVVSGTTGWLDRYSDVAQLAEQKQVGFLYASNFSLGVNLFFELNKKLATLMDPYPEYKVEVEEIHHTKKLDAPSGTAITLAGQVIEQLDRKKKWALGADAEDTLNITARREPNVPGTHRIRYHSSIDDIEISHTAHKRRGFALGAVIAAEYIAGKSGVFTMKDVLNLN